MFLDLVVVRHIESLFLLLFGVDGCHVLVLEFLVVLGLKFLLLIIYRINLGHVFMREAVASAKGMGP
jgi:hypothetical protein